MKIRSVMFAVVLATSTLTMTGCGLLDQGVQKYDELVNKDEVCMQKWSDYESQLQRRGDMIPQLVSVVKGSAAHEHSTLNDVVQARANATRPEIKLDAKTDDFSDPAKFKAYQQAQGNLSQALGRLMMVKEAYPELQANKAFHDLQIQIEGTENRLLRAREEYNKAVQAYNLELRRVSGKVINPITGHEFKPRVYFSADESAKAVPKIDFNTPPASSGK